VAQLEQLIRAMDAKYTKKFDDQNKQIEALLEQNKKLEKSHADLKTHLELTSAKLATSQSELRQRIEAISVQNVIRQQQQQSNQFFKDTTEGAKFFTNQPPEQPGQPKPTPPLKPNSSPSLSPLPSQPGSLAGSYGANKNYRSTSGGAFSSYLTPLKSSSSPVGIPNPSTGAPRMMGTYSSTTPLSSSLPNQSGSNPNINMVPQQNMSSTMGTQK